MRPYFLIISCLSAIFFPLETVAESHLRIQHKPITTITIVDKSTSISPTLAELFHLLPSSQPTNQLHGLPSRQPIKVPSNQPTNQPKLKPSLRPINHPTSRPTRQPLWKPSCQPILSPSRQPSKQPYSGPTKKPTTQPSFQPTLSPNRPSRQPSKQPSFRPTNQPTQQPSHHPSSAPNRPSSQPTKQPSRQPWKHPTSAPSSRPTSHPSSSPKAHAWFYDTFMDFQSIAYLVMYSITGVLFLVSFLIYLRSDLSNEKKKNILNLLSVFNFMIWSTFHLVMLAARFNFWLENDKMYQPYRMNSNGGMVWVDRSTFFRAGKSTLINFGCEHSFDHPQGYSAVVDSPCRFLFFDISVLLMLEGEVKFSIGCGLIIFIFYQAFIMVMEWVLAHDENNNNSSSSNQYAAPPEAGNSTAHDIVTNEVEISFNSSDDAIQPAVSTRNVINNCDVLQETRRTSIGVFLTYLNPLRLISLVCVSIQQNGFKWLFKYIVTTLINCQQSLVLLPLTNMNTNDFCVQVITPTNNENAVCLYKYAAYGLPNFFIFGLYGVIGAGLTAACISGENIVTACLAVLFGLGAAFCAVIAAAFLAFYLFAGFFVGLWFQFGVYLWALQTSRPELLSVSLFIFVDILCAILKETN